MKNKNILLFNFILFIFIIILKFVFIDNFTKYYEIVNSIFWLISLIFTISVFGYKKDNTSCKHQIIQVTIISLLVFILVTYLSGLIFGFLKNAYDLSILSIIKNTYSTLIMIICEEIIRYIIAKKEVKSSKCLIILTILYSLLDFILIFNSNSLKTRMDSFVFITKNIIPSISRHALCSYIAKNSSYIPCLIIQLYFGLNKYMIPIFPDYGNYFTSIIGIIYPYIVYIIVRKIIIDYKHEKYVKIKKELWYVNFPIIIFLLVVISLSLGIFKYKMIAIASGSMEPTFYRGDAIIYEKVSEKNKPKAGEVIVFKHDGEFISHRIININIKDNDITYQTKGDNNSVEDDFIVKDEDVVGTVKLRLKYIGIPTIWLNELIN